MSTQYEKLKTEIESLRRALLPEKSSGSEGYDPEDSIKTAAYRVLVHGAIEQYLEDRLWEIALAATRAFKERNKASITILALIAFSGRNMDKPPNSLSPEQSSQLGRWDEKIKLSKKIDLAMSDFHYVLSQNNGIKEENIVRLLIPIGVDCDDLDTVLIADLNSYGASRGLVAHQGSKSYSATEQIDPKEELKKVKSLVSGMASIDRVLDKLLVDLCE